MQKIILGNLKNNHQICKSISEIFSEIKSLDQNTINDYDFLFFNQYKVNSNCGIEYRINDNYVEIIISQSQPPSKNAIKNTILELLLKI